MTGIERLVDIVSDGPYSGGMIHISVQKLREICEQIEREVADISGYKSAVVAFVEEKGGLEVIKEWLRETMPRAAHDRINRRKNRRIRELENELEDMRGRLMPEGIKWPMFEDDKLVGFGDEYVNAKGNVSTLRTIVIKDCRDQLGGGYYWKLGKGACAVVVKNGERIKHPPVLAADGEPLEAGQTVWRIDTGAEYWVKSGLTITADAVVIIRKTDCDCESEIVKASQLTHQCPVLDAGGVPIKKGDTVWLVDQSDSDWKFTVANVLAPNERSDGKWSVKVKTDWGVFTYRKPSQLTHTKPEPDSWSSVWADVSNGNETPEGMMRRCRALAERGE